MSNNESQEEDNAYKALLNYIYNSDTLPSFSQLQSASKKVESVYREAGKVWGIYKILMHEHPNEQPDRNTSSVLQKQNATNQTVIGNNNTNCNQKKESHPHVSLEWKRFLDQYQRIFRLNESQLQKTLQFFHEFFQNKNETENQDEMMNEQQQQNQQNYFFHQEIIKNSIKGKGKGKFQNLARKTGISLEQLKEQENLNNQNNFSSQKSLALASEEELELEYLNLSEEDQAFFKKNLEACDGLPMSFNNDETLMKYKAMLYLPSMGQLYNECFDGRIKIYACRVFIEDYFDDVIPSWMNFLSGIVNIEKDYLPSVSSNNHNQIKKILQERLIENCLQFMVEIQNDQKYYSLFLDKFQTSLANEILTNIVIRERLIDLFRFHTSMSLNNRIGFKEYLAKMKNDEMDVFYILGQEKEQIESLPIIKKAQQQFLEFFYFVNFNEEKIIKCIGEVLRKNMKELTENSFQQYLIEKQEKLQKQEKLKMQFQLLINFMEKVLSNEINQVILEDQQVNSPCYINHQTPESKKILRINPQNDIIQALLVKVQQNDQTSKIFQIMQSLLIASNNQQENSVTGIYKMIKVALNIIEE